MLLPVPIPGSRNSEIAHFVLQTGETFRNVVGIHHDPDHTPYAEFGNATAAKQGVTSALALAPGRDVKVLAALTSARVGETARAKTMIEDLERNNPSNTVLKLYWLPTLKGGH
jgi:hypothetical protein